MESLGGWKDFDERLAVYSSLGRIFFIQLRETGYETTLGVRLNGCYQNTNQPVVGNNLSGSFGRIAVTELI